ncbi:winged helix-turn-helix domain-containing protein [Shinella sp. BYT-45]|uniref:winged helix-turn-helix domain-containing protein n=1 Tax=Shinella sp. BYT-45 TaxID=3377377 RepID=UPI00397F8902
MTAASFDHIIAEQKLALETLRERIRQLEEALSPTFLPPVEFGLTASEAKVLSCLISRDVATKQQIMTTIYSDRVDDEPDPKIVDVFVCKLRKKLKPHGVIISTVWGQGYRLENRDQFRVDNVSLVGSLRFSGGDHG